MAPHEKVFVDRAFLQDENHGQIDCVDCHGGNPEAPDWETAHQGVVRDPTYPEAAGVCGDCHEDIVAHNKSSLHTTLQPYRLVTEARADERPAIQAKLQTARAAHCDSCHSSCGQCHVSRPASVAGGLLDGHRFQRKPPNRVVCMACHGSRIQKEFLGENEGVAPDVHRSKYMRCEQCHPAKELHGTGKAVASRYEVEHAPACVDCHAAIYEAKAEHAEVHATHKGSTSCQVCHAQPYKQCAACHVQKDQAGQPFFKTAASWLDLKIGLNPLRSERRPEKFVLLRHVPVDHETFAFYAKDALTRFDRVPTWKFTTPHTIQRKTRQNADCNSCHGNAALFLRAQDVAEAERQANRDVIVPPGMIPGKQ